MADPNAFPDKEKEIQNESVDQKIKRIIDGIDFKAIDKKIDEKNQVPSTFLFRSVKLMVRCTMDLSYHSQWRVVAGLE